VAKVEGFVMKLGLEIRGLGDIDLLFDKVYEEIFCLNLDETFSESSWNFHGTFFEFSWNLFPIFSDS
jgi:hypothetical protein